MKVLVGVILCLYIYGCVAPPVDERKKKKDKEHAENNEIDQQVFDVEYKRYLQEVVNVLESDDDFRQKLMKADPEDIKTGKISKDLEFVNHNVRTKLDELKRQEMERLRQAAIRHYEESNGIDRKHMKVSSINHLDHENPHTFEAEDLKKLIVQTTKELEDVDRQRKDEFKEYEMRKELEYEEQLKHMDEKNRAEAEKHHAKLLEKHRVGEHKPLHHPGSKQQLEQVWEEQDHLAPEDFNPKTFFHLHDLDGNGVWDANEVKALFKKELDKMYDPNAPEDDIRERFEEMERMREHVFNETDTNRDQLISYQEFLDQTKKQEFEKDEGWDPIDTQNHPVYTQDEFKQYQQTHEEEIRRMIEQGLIPPAPPGYVPMIIPPGSDPHGQFQGHHPQMGHPQQGHPQMGHPQQGHPQQGHPQLGHHPQQGHPQMGHPDMGHPQMGHPQQGHPQQGHPQQGHPQQGHPQQGHPQIGHHPQQGQVQAHPQQGHPQQQAGYHIPPEMHPNALPPQGYHPQAGQQHYQQPPQHHEQFQQHQPQGQQQFHQPQIGQQNHPNAAPQQQQNYQQQPLPPSNQQQQYHNQPNNPAPAAQQQQQAYQPPPQVPQTHNADTHPNVQNPPHQQQAVPSHTGQGSVNQQPPAGAASGAAAPASQGTH